MPKKTMSEIKKDLIGHFKTHGIKPMFALIGMAMKEATGVEIVSITTAGVENVYPSDAQKKKVVAKKKSRGKKGLKP